MGVVNLHDNVMNVMNGYKESPKLYLCTKQ